MASAATATADIHLRINLAPITLNFLRPRTVTLNMHYLESPAVILPRDLAA